MYAYPLNYSWVFWAKILSKLTNSSTYFKQNTALAECLVNDSCNNKTRAFLKL